MILLNVIRYHVIHHPSRAISHLTDFLTTKMPLLHQAIHLSTKVFESITMSSPKPRGILRNKSVSEEPKHFSENLDRQEVIRNTRLNAQLAAESTEGDKIRNQLAKEHAQKIGPNGIECTHGDEHLKWDEINLYQTEQEKAATMKIDEPKTPYEGGFNPDGEYYQDEDEDEIAEFSLGKGQYDHVDANVLESLNGGKIIPNENLEEEEENEPPKPELTAEERHKLFEERRKAHYHMKGDVLHHSATKDP